MSHLGRKTAVTLSAVFDSENVQKEGYLTKKGGGQKRSNWTKRWFIITRVSLLYYKSQRDVKPKGGIVLADIQEVTPNEDQPIYGFNVVTPERVYRMCAKTDQERSEWIRAIIQAQAGQLPIVPSKHLDVHTHTPTIASAATIAVTTTSSSSPQAPNRWVTTTGTISNGRTPLLSRDALAVLKSSSSEGKTSSSPATPSATSPNTSAPSSPRLEASNDSSSDCSSRSESGHHTPASRSNSGTNLSSLANLNSLVETSFNGGKKLSGGCSSIGEELDLNLLRQRLTEEISPKKDKEKNEEIDPPISIFQLVDQLLVRVSHLKEQLQQKEEATLRAFQKIKEVTEENARLKSELQEATEAKKKLTEETKQQVASVESTVNELKKQLQKINEASNFVHELMEEKRKYEASLLGEYAPDDDDGHEYDQGPMGLPKTLLEMSKTKPMSKPVPASTSSGSFSLTSLFSGTPPIAIPKPSLTAISDFIFHDKQASEKSSLPSSPTSSMIACSVCLSSPCCCATSPRSKSSTNAQALSPRSGRNPTVSSPTLPTASSPPSTPSTPSLLQSLSRT
eukprot:TRINITY_DN14585_c0_g1_i1.p1 TRINITY_DN14585_c0_g1~~TRINITY_DN14585_c0_g1_i1.p1  ORF type:complete len:566 (-),score=140.83 TRINITY_DN14585_c0_g1_i1:181-1878(-)